MNQLVFGTNVYKTHQPAVKSNTARARALYTVSWFLNGKRSDKKFDMPITTLPGTV